MVEGETGLLVPPGDADALAEAIVRVLADPDLTRRLSEAGRARAVERYSWDVIADATVALHRRLLDRRPGRPSLPNRRRPVKEP